MNRTSKFILGIILLSTVLLTGCSSVIRSFEDSGGDMVNVQEEKYHNLSGVDAVNIDVSSADINIIMQERDDVKVELTGEKSSNMEHELEVEEKGNELKIAINYLNKINFGRADFTLNIYLPDNYQQELEIDVTSGDVTIENVNPNSLEIEMSSGDISLVNITTSKLFIDVTSGDTNISNVNSELFDLDTSSGSIKADHLSTDDFEYNITSGDINLTNFAGNIKGEGSSTDMSIAYKTFSNDIELQTTSGDVKIELPSNAEFYLSAEVTSGKIKCDFPVTVVGEHKDGELKGTVKSDNNTISIDTSSGDISIIK